MRAVAPEVQIHHKTENSFAEMGQRRGALRYEKHTKSGRHPCTVLSQIGSIVRNAREKPLTTIEVGPTQFPRAGQLMTPRGRQHMRPASWDLQARGRRRRVNDLIVRDAATASRRCRAPALCRSRVNPTSVAARHDQAYRSDPLG